MPRQAAGDPPGKQKAFKAAKVLFARNGYQNTTTKEIADLAGISQATIFKYYGTKEELFRSIFRQLAETSRKDFFQRVQAAGSLEGLVHLCVTDRLEFFRHYQLEIMIMLQEYLVGNQNLLSADELIRFAGAAFGQTVERIRQQPTRLNPKYSAIDVLRTIMGLMGTYLIQLVNAPTLPRPTEEELEQQILRSLTVD